MLSTQLNSTLPNDDAEVLALHCSDQRFPAGFHEFLRRTLKLELFCAGWGANRHTIIDAVSA